MPRFLVKLTYAVEYESIVLAKDISEAEKMSEAILDMKAEDLRADMSEAHISTSDFDTDVFLLDDAQGPADYEPSDLFDEEEDE
jgi:hypothetical protein